MITVYPKTDASETRSDAVAYAEINALEAQRWAELATAGIHSWAEVWHQAVHRFGNRLVAIEVESGERVTYAELDERARRVAAWAVKTQERQIAICLDNGIPFLTAAIGLAYAGVTGILLNTREPEERLGRLAQLANCRHVIGRKCAALEAVAVDDILRDEADAGDAWESGWPVRLESPAFVIFTSGTSGLSKGAKFSHRRLIGAGVAWGLRTGMTMADRCYIALPMFHGNGLAVAFASVVEVGATAVLRARFSVRNFTHDIAGHQCTAFVYIGELWRYLHNHLKLARGAVPPIRVAFGNGLGADLWDEMVRTFQLQRVVEHYGATEMPAGALTNFVGRRGSCGFVPRDDPRAEEILVVDSTLKPVPAGVGGELLLRCHEPYDGYINPEDSARKVARDVVAPGDLWWRSGDCLIWHGDGHFEFVRRMGDSFRWKGENVSCAEVEHALYSTGLFRETAVYGIQLPNYDGSAGMASVIPKNGADPDLAAAMVRLRGSLAPHAIPRFVRVQHEAHPVTSTLKIRKEQLASQGLSRHRELPHFVLIEHRYERLTETLLASLAAGELPL
jgi:acyl-CoA synthetase (AMP-forming)/AMP-acid ligase II